MPDDQLSALAGETFDPNALLDYQNGAIVSRTLVDRGSTTITVFAVDAGQSISEHTAHHDAIMQVLDGTANVTVDEDAYAVPAGEALVFPAGEPHALHGEERFKMLLTMVAGED
jgi:quercetin dioxygenase-like cupin family protein